MSSLLNENENLRVPASNLGLLISGSAPVTQDDGTIDPDPPPRRNNRPTDVSTSARINATTYITTPIPSLNHVSFVGARSGHVPQPTEGTRFTYTCVKRNRTPTLIPLRLGRANAASRAGDDRGPRDGRGGWWRRAAEQIERPRGAARRHGGTRHGRIR